jgi:hypothetical protein
LGIKNEYRLSIQTWCYPFNTESEASYRKRPAGHTAGLFFIPRDTPLKITT